MRRNREQQNKGMRFLRGSPQSDNRSARGNLHKRALECNERIGSAVPEPKWVTRGYPVKSVAEKPLAAAPSQVTCLNQAVDFRERVPASITMPFILSPDSDLLRSVLSQNSGD